MSNNINQEPMIEMFIFETTQQIEQLEKYILSCEKDGSFSREAINDIFRIMHTIKGSSAMMLFKDISNLAHSIEDIFFYIREENPASINFTYLSDLILDGIDFIKIELEKLNNGDPVDGDAGGLIKAYKDYLAAIKNENSTDTKSPDAEAGSQESTDNIQY